MAKVFSRSITNPIPGSFNPSGINYAVSTTAGQHSTANLKETAPYILPPVWDYRKLNKIRRPMTPIPTRTSPPVIDFILYHPDGMVPYYTGYIPNHKFKIGITFGRSTKEYGLLHYSKKTR